MDKKWEEAQEMGLTWPPAEVPQVEEPEEEVGEEVEQSEQSEVPPDPRPLTPDPYLEDEEDEELDEEEELEEEEEDEEDLYRGPSATFALEGQTPAGSTVAPVMPYRPLTAAEADRIRGYPLTAGVAPFNGPNRSNTAENAGPSGAAPAR